MSNYKLVHLKDIADSQTGPFGSQLHQSDYVSEGTPMVTVEHLGVERFTHQNLPFVSDKDRDRLSKYILREGDIVFSRVGSVDRCTYVTKKEDGWMFSGRCIRVRSNENANGRYLNFYFRQDTFKKMMLDISVGATMPSLNTKLMDNIPLRLPNIKTQQKIAKVLSDLDSKIELNNKINAELEAMAKTLYDYWFVQFDFPYVTSRGVEKPYKSSGGKMVWNKELKREIPEGWEVKPLNNVIETILDHRGKTPKKLGGDWTDDENGIIALSAKIVKGGKLINLDHANKVSQELYDKWMSVKLIDGDILMTSEAPAGEFYFIQGKTDYCMSQRLFGIRANKTNIIPSYLYYELSKGNGYSQIMGSLSGSTVFGIRQDVLRTILVIIPKLEIQKKFDKTVLSQLKQIKQLDQQNEELASLRDWLLPMLMNGQVSVGGYEVEDRTLGMVAESAEEYKKG